MTVEQKQSAATHSTENAFPPLGAQGRATVPTDTAAFHLNRKPQTLRQWACYETGPIRPMRINGRLAWPVAQIKKLLGQEVNA